MSINDEVKWITVSDDMINSFGYKSCKSNLSNNRSALFKRIKKTYTKNKEYRFKKPKYTGKKGSGGHNKQTLEMTQAAYTDFVQQTYTLRKPKTKAVKHFVYVMHNPMFLHYGPNVYKIGYTENVKRCVKDYKTGYIEESTVVFSKQVPSKECERKLHKLMTMYRINPKREFFNCPLSRVKQFIDTL